MNGNGGTPVLALQGGEQELRRGPGAERGRLRGPPRRGRRLGRRQRSRQVDAGEDDRRDPQRRRGTDPLRGPGGEDPGPRTRRRSGSRPSTRTSRCATTSTWSRTSSSDRRRSGKGRRRSCASSTRPRWRSGRANCSAPGGDDHRRARGGGHDVGRPAPAGRDRALAAWRTEGRDARRADGGARRAPDRAGARADQAAARRGARRPRDQPQPRRRLRGRRPHLRAAARARGGRLRSGRGVARRRSWPRSPEPSSATSETRREVRHECAGRRRRGRTRRGRGRDSRGADLFRRFVAGDLAEPAGRPGADVDLG